MRLRSAFVDGELASGFNTAVVGASCARLLTLVGFRRAGSL
jgi:hypothetical protein